MSKNTSFFSVNERVSHSVYGQGTISEIDQLHTVIEFDRDGRKKFITSMVQLEHSDQAAPEPSAKRSKSAKSKSKPSKSKK